MRSLRPIALVVLVVGVVCLAIGFAIESDLFGLFFMICLIAAVVLFVVDLVRRRRAA